ncbi:hypothetical protein NXS97_00520 [Pantoea sp. B623]|uniref:ECs_2282 family putative zinc-binding protein n=1 Tax=Pantoea sp. B623 TaxID=2974561 RepID=UPI0021694C17|nr:hypothetical protein [Pantoea sp. B623]MCS4492697.1 hypothetical protein [Pantoea sp. B623]
MSRFIGGTEEIHNIGNQYILYKENVMKLNPEKYNRNIALLCPVCGNTEMEYSDESEIVKCIGCGKELTKDELTQENGAAIEAHVDEIKKELTKDIQRQFNDMLKKAFKGNKSIRIK